MFVEKVRFGSILIGEDFLRSPSDAIVWRRKQGAYAIRVDLIGDGKGSWPVDVDEMVTPVSK
jgi:hypothetical protein